MLRGINLFFLQMNTIAADTYIDLKYTTLGIGTMFDFMRITQPRSPISILKLLLQSILIVEYHLSLILQYRLGIYSE